MRLLAPMVSTLLAFSAAATPAAADEVSLRADIWCPYNCAPGSTQPGYMVEIARTVFEAAGHRLDYRLVNWSRAIRMAELGEIDGIIGATREEAPDFVFPRQSLGRSKDAYFTLTTNDWVYAGPESFADMRIGLIQDYDYAELRDALPASATMEFATGDRPLLVNFRKLTAGRIDVVVSDENVANLVLRDLDGANAIRVAGHEADYKGGDLFIAFSPVKEQSKAYARILSEGVSAMRRGGMLARLLARYGLKDWKTREAGKSLSHLAPTQ